MGYSSFQIGCVIVEYGLFNTTTLIQNLIYIYIRFSIILTQFYINFSKIFSTEYTRKSLHIKLPNILEILYLYL